MRQFSLSRPHVLGQVCSFHLNTFGKAALQRAFQLEPPVNCSCAMCVGLSVVAKRFPSCLSDKYDPPALVEYLHLCQHFLLLVPFFVFAGVLGQHDYPLYFQ